MCVLWRLGKAKEVGSGVKGTRQALQRELDTWTCIQLRVRQLANLQHKTAACCGRRGSPDLLRTGCCQGKGMRSVSQASRASKPQREREAVQRTTVIGCGLRQYLPRVHAHTQWTQPQPNVNPSFKTCAKLVILLNTWPTAKNRVSVDMKCFKLCYMTLVSKVWIEKIKDREVGSVKLFWQCTGWAHILVFG